MKRNLIIVGALVVVCALIIAAGQRQPSAIVLAAPANMGDAEPTAEPKYEGKVTAPEFPVGLEWVNVEQPLSILQLRGKIVMLDFWTYGCINCIHIIPDIKRLEAQFPDELVVIGVHSAKFKNEGNTRNIREVVQRYEVTHPVINDYDFDVWNQYGAEAWPTLILIDPAGKIVGVYSGEGVYGVFAPVLTTMVRQWDARKAIDRTPIVVSPELGKRAPSPLSFPGKVLADVPGNRLFISDSNHNRIIIADLKTYEVRAIIGSGAPALRDGAYTTAGFYRPQGLALAGDTLYVADTENHALRAVDLKAGKVTTLAGTGEQALKRNTGGKALSTQLNSPWDVAVVGDKVYVAMAGTHQLWAYSLTDSSIAPFAGSGREGLFDGTLTAAQLAQPSGLITDGKTLYFTDPESSAIRSVGLVAEGQVRTLIGKGLFDFGDVDGVKDNALIQHALGVTLAPDGALYIADTYNHKIKRIDPATNTIVTLFGGAENGLKDGVGNAALFNEPGGLSIGENKLYVADTNNDAIRVIDLLTSQVSTVKFPNEDVLVVSSDERAEGEPISLPAQTVAPDATQITVTITVPPDYKLNATAPFTLSFAPNPVVVIAADKAEFEQVKPSMPIRIPASFRDGQTVLTAEASVYYCDAINERLCYVSRLSFALPVKVAAGGEKTLTLAYEVVPPKAPNSSFRK